MMKKLLGTCLILFGLIPAARADSPVVVELFTSQSCSSCPPADAVLGKLAQDDDVIALSCNVTYWNHLHWKDTLSREFCTRRQQDYVRAKGLRGPYTPQIVVNGSTETVGSREGQVKKLVDQAQTIGKIDVKPETGIVSIALPSIAAGNYTLTLFTFDTAYTQAIPSGENRGRTVTYTNPVTAKVELGSWDGQARDVRFDTSGYQPKGGYAVLAQDKSGTIHAAGQLRL